MSETEHRIAVAERDRWMAQHGAVYVGQSGYSLVYKNDAGTLFVVTTEPGGQTLRIVEKPPRCVC